MIRRMSIGGLVLAGLAAAAIAASPALRARVTQQWAALCGWTKEAREADPVGFASYAEKRLKHDLDVMKETRRELAAEVGQLAQKEREQQALGDQARQLAEKFRAQYQLASTNGGFPIEVRNAAYTEGQAKAQVSMLLAEAEGYEQAMGQLTDVRKDAESKIEELVVRINSTETQLAALSTKRELLRARQLTAEGEQLLAQVDQLMTGNTQLIEGNPVRTVRELLDAPVAKPQNTASQQRVEQFLAATPVIDTDDSPVSVQEASSHQRPGKAKNRPKRTTAAKPIFQQSSNRSGIHKNSVGAELWA